jgi:hypothetical protein
VAGCIRAAMPRRAAASRRAKQLVPRLRRAAQTVAWHRRARALLTQQQRAACIPTPRPAGRHMQQIKCLELRILTCALRVLLLSLLPVAAACCRQVRSLTLALLRPSPATTQPW